MKILIYYAVCRLKYGEIVKIMVCKHMHTHTFIYVYINNVFCYVFRF